MKILAQILAYTLLVLVSMLVLIPVALFFELMCFQGF